MNADLSEISRQTGLSESELAELMRLFVESAKKDIAQLEMCLRRKDHAAARYVLHSLKGAAINLDLKEFGGCCENLLSAIEAHRYEDGRAAVDTMKRIVDNLSLSLRVRK